MDDIRYEIHRFAKQEGIAFCTAASILGRRGAAAQKRKKQPSKEEIRTMDKWLKDEYYKPFTYNPDMKGDK